MTHATQDLGDAFQDTRRALLGYLRRRVSDAAVAEDLLQDVFLKALLAGKSGAQPRHLTGWLYGIANNAVVDYYRARKPMEPVPEDLAPEEIAEDRVPQELTACLLPLTKVMPAIYRDTLIATEFEGRALADVSREWNLSLSAIKSRASRGRRMLKELLMRRCEVAVSRAGEVDFSPSVMRKCEGGRGCA